MHLTVDREEAHARLRAVGCTFVAEVVLGTETWRAPNGDGFVLNYEHVSDFPEMMIIEAERLAKQA